jgi:hypothetical protein
MTAETPAAEIAPAGKWYTCDDWNVQANVLRAHGVESDGKTFSADVRNQFDVSVANTDDQASGRVVVNVWLTEGAAHYVGVADVEPNETGPRAVTVTRNADAFTISGTLSQIATAGNDFSNTPGPDKYPFTIELRCRS